MRCDVERGILWAMGASKMVQMYSSKRVAGNTEYDSCGMCVRWIALAGKYNKSRSEQFMPRLDLLSTLSISSRLWRKFEKRRLGGCDYFC